MKPLFVLTLILIAFIINGCTYTEYQHISPVSQQGKSCVNQCAYEKELCSADKDRTNQDLRIRYQRDMNRYERCKRNTPKDAKNNCRKPYQEYAEGFNCNRIYDACFKNCGGKIIAVEKKL